MLSEKCPLFGRQKFNLSLLLIHALKSVQIFSGLPAVCSLVPSNHSTPFPLQYCGLGYDKEYVVLYFTLKSSIVLYSINQ